MPLVSYRERHSEQLFEDQVHLMLPIGCLDKCRGNAMVFCEMLWTTTEIQRFINKVNIFGSTMALPSNTLSLYQCWRSYFETSQVIHNQVINKN